MQLRIELSMLKMEIKIKHSARNLILIWSFLTSLILECSGGGSSSGTAALSHAASQVPAMFVFGDSLVDNGNNNFLASIAKSNYFPYGIDFFQGPTGRFCNGKTVIDALCDILGLAYLPPFASPGLSRRRLLHGVNYASAAAGILDDSGQYLGQRYSLRQQVVNFQTNLNDLKTLIGSGNFDHYLAKSIVVMILGSNDYINNYLLPSLYPTSYQYNPKQYAKLLTDQYTKQILALHGMGLRKFLLAGVGPLGCIPNQRATALAPPGQCVEQVNEIVDEFNERLQELTRQLNADIEGAYFVFGDTYRGIMDILSNSSRYGFSVTDRGCCGVGRNGGQLTCLPLTLPCAERGQYVFWDAYHPTEAVNLILGQKAFNGPLEDVYPINLQQLAQL